MWIRLFAASRSLSDLRPSRVKFSRFESRVYFCPLMKRRCFPVNRAYSLLRTLSKASPRWRSTWNLSKRMLASGAWALVEVRNGFHMSMTAIRIPLLFLGPSHSKNSSMLASERSLPPNQMGRPRTRSLTTIR